MQKMFFLICLVMYAMPLFAQDTLIMDNSGNTEETVPTPVVASLAETPKEKKHWIKGDVLRNNYLNLNFFAFQNMTFNMTNGIVDVVAESNWSTGFSTGRSYIVHKKPIAGFIHIGIDATWFDADVAHFKYGRWNGDNGGYYDEFGNILFSQREFNLDRYRIDMAMGIGVSVHFTPVDKFGIHSYIRYNPTLTTLCDFNDGFAISGGFASGIVIGGAISWRLISFGVEMRRNIGLYKPWKGNTAEGKINTKGYRIYLGFRF